MQKKRWPFFFLAGRLSLFTLSFSEAAWPSSSSITTSLLSVERVEFSELPRRRVLLRCCFLDSWTGAEGSEGSGRWPANPPKLSRVGVFADWSSS